MALPISELITLRDALIRARSQGVREVRDQNGESVTYKSDSEMARALASLEGQIQSASQPQSVKTILFTTNKGLES